MKGRTFGLHGLELIEPCLMKSRLNLPLRMASSRGGEIEEQGFGIKGHCFSQQAAPHRRPKGNISETWP